MNVWRARPKVCSPKNNSHYPPLQVTAWITPQNAINMIIQRRTSISAAPRPDGDLPAANNSPDSLFRPVEVLQLGFATRHEAEGAVRNGKPSFQGATDRVLRWRCGWGLSMKVRPRCDDKSLAASRAIDENEDARKASQLRPAGLSTSFYCAIFASTCGVHGVGHEQPIRDVPSRRRVSRGEREAWPNGAIPSLYSTNDGVLDVEVSFRK